MSNGDAEILALLLALDGDDELQIALGEAVGRFRRRRDAAIRDQEAARLLPLGWQVVAERLDVKKSTVYKMNQRARSTVTQAA